MDALETYFAELSANRVAGAVPETSGYGTLHGLAASPVVGVGGLAGVDLKSQTFTVVGYGYNGFVSGSAISWRNPVETILWSGRNYREGSGSSARTTSSATAI